MALVTRLARLFRADFNAVLDRVEEPDLLLRQAVREMEEALARDEQGLKRLEHEQQQLAARDAELQRAEGDLEEELDVCFVADNEDLARHLMKRTLQGRQARQLLGRRREALEARLGQLKRRLEDNRASYESMRQKAELLTEQAAPVSEADFWTAPDLSVRDEDVEVALLREKQRRAKS